MKDEGRAERDLTAEVAGLQQRIAELEAAQEKRRQAEGTLRRRNLELELLNRAGQAFSSTLDLEQVLATILEEVRRLLGVAGSSVWLVDLETGELVCQEAAGPKSEIVSGWRLAPGQGIAGWVASSATSLIVPDTQADERYFKGVGREMGMDLRSVLSVPMQVKHDVIGVLQVVDTEADRFRTTDVTLLEALAASAATAIENARLYEAVQQELTERRQAQETLRRRAEELAALQATVLDITAPGDLSTLLETIVERAARLLSALGGGLYLRDPWRQGVQCVVSYNAPRDYRGIALRYGEGAAGTVALTGKPLIIEDYRFWPGRAAVFEEEQPFAAVLAAPMIWQGEVIGVIDLLRDEEAPSFTETDLELLSLFANHAAIAVENARLYEEVRRHADELMTSLVRLQELDHLKSEFIQNVSHELRSPLALIRGYAELLETGELGELQGEQRESVEVISRRARMLGDLVEDITLLLVAQTRKMEQQPLALGELVQAAVEDFRVAADRAGLTLTAEIASDLPQVNAASLYLRRVLDNLLGNAIKFTPSGGTVTVRARQEVEQVVLEVSDTGIGISPEQQEHIFERFYQVDGSLQRRYGGVGLGLALVKEIAEAHGGTVGVESQVGQGSTFTVTLPVRPG